MIYSELRVTTRFPAKMRKDISSYLTKMRKGGERYSMNQMIVDAVRLTILLEGVFSDELTDFLPIEFDIPDPT